MNNNGESKFKEVGEKLKAEKAAKDEAVEETRALVENQLQALRENETLAKMYADNAAVGAQNLAGELPLLKVHATGRSSANILADGSEPHDGYFFYKPTGEQFETVTAHILTISRGFFADGMAQADGTTKKVFNQIVGGVIVDNGEYKPFIMYFTGTKLQNLWEFGKQAAKYTRAKPVPIPMFALTVKMSTVRQENKFGRSWVITFEIEKNDSGIPSLVLDPGEFQFLKDNVETLEETIASLIETKATKDVVEAHNDSVITGEAMDAPPVSFDDTPF